MRDVRCTACLHLPMTDPVLLRLAPAWLLVRCWHGAHPHSHDDTRVTTTRPVWCLGYARQPGPSRDRPVSAPWRSSRSAASEPATSSRARQRGPARGLAPTARPTAPTATAAGDLHHRRRMTTPISRLLLWWRRGASIAGGGDGTAARGVLQFGPTLNSASQVQRDRTTETCGVETA